MNSSDYVALKLILRDKNNNTDPLADDPYLEIFRKITSKYESENSTTLNKNRLPNIPDQNIDMPIAVAEDTNTTILLFSKSLIIRKMVSTKIDINATNDLIESFFKLLNIVTPDQIVACSLLVSKNKPVTTLDSLKTVLYKTPYIGIADKVNNFGFSFQFFTDTKLSTASSQSISYSVNTDTMHHSSFLNSTLTIIVGGIDFTIGDFVQTEKLDIEQFSDIYIRDEVGSALEEFYEPLQLI